MVLFYLEFVFLYLQFNLYTIPLDSFQISHQDLQSWCHCSKSGSFTKTSKAQRDAWQSQPWLVPSMVQPPLFSQVSWFFRKSTLDQRPKLKCYNFLSIHSLNFFLGRRPLCSQAALRSCLSESSSDKGGRLVLFVLFFVAGLPPFSMAQPGTVEPAP